MLTTTSDDFTRAFRSGQYNTYWITGGLGAHHDVIGISAAILGSHGETSFSQSFALDQNFPISHQFGSGLLILRHPDFDDWAVRRLVLEEDFGAVGGDAALAGRRGRLDENLVGRVDAILGSWDPVVRHDPLWTWPTGLARSLVSGPSTRGWPGTWPTLPRANPSPRGA